MNRKGNEQWSWLRAWSDPGRWKNEGNNEGTGFLVVAVVQLGWYKKMASSHKLRYGAYDSYILL